MTLHPKKPVKSKSPARTNWTNAAPATIGDLLGAQFKSVQSERARRAELDAAGFRAIKSGA